MSFDYSALRGRIVERYGTTTAFAEKIGMSRSSLSLKLNNKSDWKQNEIENARCALGITISEISKYFFCARSSRNRTS